MTKADKFNPTDFESKWMDQWQKERLYETNFKSAKNPFYNLMMFPYPSAEGLHVGSFFTFSGIDTYGRFKRMCGYDVFEPIGLDAFGIHSENYAIKVNKHPRQQAKISQKNFYMQLHQMGNMFDWDRTVETNEPNYYKWTQWLFIKMFKAGLAYRAAADVNWCPSCKTVLADEQVIKKTSPHPSPIRRGAQGGEVNVCERCGSEVEKKNLEQWFFRIATGKRPDGTPYPDSLLNNLSKIDWVDKVKIGQRNWIGKKEGIVINYPITQLSLPAQAGNNPINKKAFQRKVILASEARPGSENLSERSSDSGQARMTGYTISCFTTRPDTNFGATFVVLAPEHKFVNVILGTPTLRQETPESDSGQARMTKMNISQEKLKEIKDYIEKAKKKSEAERIAERREKTGVFTGFYAINQLNNYQMPIYISDFVLGNVGTGAVVGVPGHDRRDFEFAQEFDLPVVRVVVGQDGDTSSITRIDQVQEEEGKMINSGFLNGMDIHKATLAMMDYLEKKGWGKRVVTYHIRDWLISRQRYWGVPIPMVYCKKCALQGRSWFTTVEVIPNEVGSEKWEARNRSERLERNLRTSHLKIQHRTSHFTSPESMPGWYPVAEDQLPVLLPDIKDWRPKGTQRGPLAAVPEFYNVACPQCRGPARRETDVCDTFLDSSWYFLRYPFTEFYDIPFASKKFQNQESQPKAGPPLAEKIKYKKVDGEKNKISFYLLPKNEQEKIVERAKKWLPVTSYIGGAEHTVLHLLYARWVTMVFYDLGYLEFEEPFSRFYAHGLIIKEGAKMSKSKGNIINPDEYVEKYGADTLRTYLRFIGPFDQGGDFRDTGIAGMYRFLGRVWRLVHGALSHKSPKLLKVLKEQEKIKRVMHRTIKEVTEDLENLRFNTAVAHIMEFVNALSDNRQLITGDHIKSLLLMLAPFAPYMTEELWQRLGRFESIHLQPWPSYDPKYLVEDEVTIVIQVNGKVRDVLNIKNQKSNIKDKVELLAKKSEKVKRHLEGKGIQKVIFVPGKLINFVV